MKNRNVDIHALEKWLLDNGLAEPRGGYGHVSGETLAFMLLSKYVILERDDETTTQ